MTTWADLLAEIRLDLKDNNEAKYKFSDDLLYLYLKDALRDYSAWLPLRKQVTLALTNNAVSLPSDYVGAAQVQCPLDTYLEERMERPGNKYAAVGTPTTYTLAGGQIRLNGDATEIILTYDALHPVPSSKDDTTFVLTPPDMDTELLRLFIKAKVYGQVRTITSNLDRFKLGGSKRDDNPVAPEVGSLMDEYLAKIAERMGGGAIRLWRPGRPR